MKTFILRASLASGMAILSTGAMADPAVYRDNTMSIKSGVLISDTAQHYYADIVLSTDASGKLTIVAATERPLVHIDSVEATVVETNTERSVTLAIAGNKSVPCVELEDVAVSRKGSVFTVLVAETVMGPAESCIAIIDPFDIEVALDVSGLAPGDYDVEVNGEALSFELTREEPKPAN